MYIVSVVASVCQFVSLVGTICSSVVVHQDGVDMYTVILSKIQSSRGRRSMTYRKTGENSDSGLKTAMDDAHSRGQGKDTGIEVNRHVNMLLKEHQTVPCSEKGVIMES